MCVAHTAYNIVPTHAKCVINTHYSSHTMTTDCVRRYAIIWCKATQWPRHTSPILCIVTLYDISHDGMEIRSNTNTNASTSTGNTTNSSILVDVRKQITKHVSIELNSILA